MSSLDETIDKSVFYHPDRKEPLRINELISLKELTEEDTYEYHYVLKEHEGEWKWFLAECIGSTVNLTDLEQALEAGA